MIAVNHEYVEQDHLLNHEDEIAFPPQQVVKNVYRNYK